MFQNETKFLINDKFLTVLNTNKEALMERSSLFRGLFETCRFEPNQPIKLKLERPEKFGILFHYLETEKMSEELTNFATFSSFINDVIYLGIDKLENHMVNMMSNAILQKRASSMDFSQSRPNYEFILQFIQSKTFENQEIDVCELVMNWVGENNIDKLQVQGLTKNIDFSQLTLASMEMLEKKYPSSFDIVMQPSALLKLQLLERVMCANCGQDVPKYAIDKEPCFKLKPGSTYVYQKDGFHRQSAFMFTSAS